MIQDTELNKKIGGSKEEILNKATNAGPTRVGWVRNWPRWTPYAAVIWSMIYAALGLYWAVSGHGFPYAKGLETNPTGPLVGRFGSPVAWIVVMMAGIPAMILGVVLLRGASFPPTTYNCRGGSGRSSLAVYVRSHLA